MNTASLTRQQARELDRRASSEYGVPSIVLMENAGRGCVDLLEQLGIQGPIALVCGKGNNGGDGLVMARHLDLRGYPVRMLWVGDFTENPPDAATNAAIVEHMRLPCTRLDSGSPNWTEVRSLLEGVDWIVDALLGTGARGDPRPPLDTLLRLLNDQPARKFAVDVPSGLDADTGQAGSPTFRADHTCTFVAPKVGFRAPEAAHWLGQLHVADIGAPRCLIEEICRK